MATFHNKDIMGDGKSHTFELDTGKEEYVDESPTPSPPPEGGEGDIYVDDDIVFNDDIESDQDEMEIDDDA